MKNMKKLVGYLLCLTLVIGCISGCGGFAGKSDEELLMSAITNINKAKSFQMDAKLTGKVSVKMGEQSQDVDMGMEMTSTQFTDPVKAKIVVKTTSAGTTTNTESYVQKEDDKYVTYTKAYDTWSKTSLGNLDEALNAAGGMNSMQTQLAEDISKYTKKEDKEEGDKKYLVYEYTVTGEDLKSMVENTMSSIGSSAFGSDELSEMLDAMIGKMGDMVMTILIDRDTENIYSIEVPMTDMMNNMMNGLIDYLKEQALKEEDADPEEVEESLKQFKIQVSDMNMSATYSKVDEAEDFTVPQEALDAEEFSLDGTDLDDIDLDDVDADDSGL